MPQTSPMMWTLIMMLMSYTMMTTKSTLSNMNTSSKSKSSEKVNPPKKQWKW